MIKKYDDFTRKMMNIDNQKKVLKKKLGGLKKQKIQVKLDKFNKQKQELQKKIHHDCRPSAFD